MANSVARAMNALDPTGRYRGRSNTDNLGGSQVLQGIPDESEDPKCKAQETWAVLKEKTVIPIAAAGHSPAVMARTKAPTVRQLSSWRPAGNVPNAAKSGAWAIWSNVPVSSASNIQHPTSNIQSRRACGPRATWKMASMASWAPGTGRTPYERDSNRASHSGSNALTTSALQKLALLDQRPPSKHAAFLGHLFPIGLSGRFGLYGLSRTHHKKREP